MPASIARVEIEVKGLKEIQARVESLGIELPKVMLRSVNRTLDAAFTQAKRDVAEETGLRQKYIAKALTKRKANLQELVATLIASETFIPLSAYLGRTRYRSGQGIAGEAYRAGTIPPGAFYAIVGTGRHRGVFRRQTAKRLPIAELPGPPIPKIILDKRIFQALQAKADTVLRRRIEVEIDRLVKSAAAKAAEGD